MGDCAPPEKITKHCTKDHPFVPPIKAGELWIHDDAYELDPADEGRYFECPHCGTIIDLGPDIV